MANFMNKGNRAKFPIGGSICSVCRNKVSCQMKQELPAEDDQHDEEEFGIADDYSSDDDPTLFDS